MADPVPYVAGEFLALQKEFEDAPDFRQSVKYQQVSIANDPITGDFIKTFTDYFIYLDVQPMEVDHKLVKAGEMEVGDAEIYLPALIKKDIYGNSLGLGFEPKIEDKITLGNYTYKIVKVLFPRFGETNMFCKCFAKRLENTV